MASSGGGAWVGAAAASAAAVAFAGGSLLGAGVASANDDSVGDPLPSISRAWDALAANFDGRYRRDIVISAHDARDRRWGGIYNATGRGSWELGFSFPNSDRHGCDSGDLSGDGRLDLYCAVGVVKGTGSGLNELWIQQPDGSFLDRAQDAGVDDPLGRGRRPLIYDHNGDGRLDLYVSNAVRSDHPGNRLWVQLSDGSFRERTTAATGNVGYRCGTSGDFNRDGSEDLLVCSHRPQGNLHLYKNKGFGHKDVSFLTGAPIVAPRDAQLAHLDSDGLLDLVVVLPNRVEIRLNRGRGRRFSKVQESVELVNGQRALVRDMTGDGKRDVYVVDGCSEDAVDSPDKLLVGPGMTTVFTPAGDPTGGCGNEAVDAGKLIVFNGDGSAVGPVTTLAYPLFGP